MTSDSIVRKNLPIPQVVDSSKAPSNHFVVLISFDAILEEGEFQQFDGIVLESEANIVTPDQAGASLSNPLWDGEPSLAPSGDCSPSSYANIACKKPADSFESSDENSIEQLSKKAGRKSKKEIQEEEAERLKKQGSQSTVEMSYGRNKRTRPPKGVITPSTTGK